ncbi:MAG TPA: isochorismatase family protein [Peptococcaceae bacterium]|jgi:nicotinamidase-related amidase|nr:isochorismatase family protein [Clostridia bacterium]HOB82677.1 isochorismatase family protein [Peptococcaceae bacterium]HPZ71884.1 isochorismatase family protein [Peptococcaceae bacterium]HQD53767.1 isochorismatase family protein [Peptococcaceae bacterium]
MDKFTLTQEDAVLMLIDIQERLVPAMLDGPKMLQNTNILITVAQKLNIPVIVTEQYPKGLGKTVPEVSANFDEQVAVYEKITFNGCIEEIAAVLKQNGKKKNIVAGMETHICVFQTVRELLAQDYQVFVVGDAVCSRTRENYLNGLAQMQAMGAVVTNTETVVFDLLKRAGTPLFKEMSKLVK